MFNQKIYQERRASLLRKMKSGIILFHGNVDVPMNYPANTYHFRQDSSFLYFCGLNLPGFFLALDVDSGREMLFGNDVDMDDIIWMGPQPSVVSFAEKAGIRESFPVSALSSMLSDAQEQGRRIHFLPPYRAETKLSLFQLLGIHPDVQKRNSSLDLIRAVVELRSVKSPEEIIEIDKSHEIAYRMHTTAMRMAKPGMLESEIAGFVEGIALSAGGTVSFPVICSIRGETLHNHYHGNLLKQGDLLLLDAGAESSSGYASDITRVIPVGGRFSSRQRDIYQIVLNANNEAIRLAKPGISYQSIHLAACRTIASGLKDLGLMKADVDEAVAAGAHTLFFPHGLGHMMGIDVHDMEDLGENNVGYDEITRRSNQFGTAYLRMGKKLQEGYVITDEPGIYFIPALIQAWKAEQKCVSFIDYGKLESYLDFGGIRLEDDLLITSEGCRLIGPQRVPVEVDEVETFMAG